MPRRITVNDDAARPQGCSRLPRASLERPGRHPQRRYAVARSRSAGDGVLCWLRKNASNIMSVHSGAL